jgi:hypothetical protein
MISGVLLNLQINNLSCNFGWYEVLKTLRFMLSNSFSRVLMMVCYTQDYQAFGPFPSYYIPKVHGILETGSVFILGVGWETSTLLGPLERANRNPVIAVLFYLITFSSLFFLGK